MLRGLRTVVMDVADLQVAKTWYTDILGYGPYFDEPFYVGFDVGGYELGLRPAEDPAAADRAIPYWAVEDLAGTLAGLVASGASEVEAITAVGGEIRVASVRDPFGHLLGLIDNPHFRAEVGAAVASDGSGLALRPIQCEVAVAAPPSQVFASWTSSEGLARWLVPHSHVELRIGGPYALLFDPQQAPGLQGSEGCRILSFLPDELLSFTWNAPPSLPQTRPLHTWVVLRFDAIEGGTRVRLTHEGWPQEGMADASGEWPATWAYFDRVWRGVLQALAAHHGALEEG